MRKRDRGPGVKKRPIGVTLSAIWMGILITPLTVVVVRSASAMMMLPLLAGVIGLGRMVLGLWAGEAWALRAFRIVLIAAFAMSVALACLGAERHGRLYYAGRSVIMAAWAYYLFRPRVRVYFASAETPLAS